MIQNRQICDSSQHPGVSGHNFSSVGTQLISKITDSFVHGYSWALNKMTFKDFPFLTPEEFSEVCHHFDSQYCRATLGPLRQRWKLRVCTALDTSFASGVEYITYLQIIRPLEATLDYGDLSSILDSFSFREGASERDELGLDDEAMIDAEESDEVMS